MIRNIIFDFGAVLLDWNPHYLYDPYFDSVEKADWFLSNICTQAWNTLQDAGRSCADGTAEKVAEFPEWEKEIRMFYGQWGKMMNGEIPGMRELVKDLKDKGFRLFGLSNWSAETFKTVSDAPILDLLEGYIVSGYVGLIKPGPEIYRLLLDRYGLKAEESLFIDDNPDNVAGAEAVGIQTILFKGREALVGELESRL